MIKVFPIDPAAGPQFAEAWGSHKGTDIFAPEGSPVLAVDNGEARAAVDPKGGTVLFLTADDGTRYYYAHLSAYRGAFPRRVNMGEPIAAVGTTGNARGKDPHLHFEVHPGGGPAVNPYPELLAVAPDASLRLPVRVLPLPPNPLKPKPAPEEKKTPGCWRRFCLPCSSLAASVEVSP